MDRCRTELPPLRPVARAGTSGARVAACWLQDGSAAPPAELARPEPSPAPAVGTESPAAGTDDAMADAGTTGGTA